MAYYYVTVMLILQLKHKYIAMQLWEKQLC